MVPPLFVACSTCGSKMVLASVEPSDTGNLYTYQCPKGHRQELAIANP
jgi:hypothetical protein